MARANGERREPLSRARIIASAVDYADEHGLPALGVRSLAQHLGVQPMSLYYHVNGKAGLIEGIIEQLLAENVLTSVRDWREWCEMVFASTREMARRHPGAVEAVFTAPVTGHTVDVAGGQGMELFIAAGFSPVDAVLSAQTVALAALGLATNERLFERLRRGLEVRPEPTAYQRSILAEISVEDVLNADVWTYALRTIITGLEASLATKPSRRLRPRPTSR